MTLELLGRIESHIRRYDLIEPGGDVVCLVSGGADSTCLFHALRELGYAVSAFHVDHGLRGAESDEDARWCGEHFDAEVVQAAGRCETEAALRDVRYSFHPDLLRATGHTLSDQVETILYRLATSGTTKGIKVCREDSVVRPLLCCWREETEAFCREQGLAWRTDSSNRESLRGRSDADVRRARLAIGQLFGSGGADPARARRIALVCLRGARERAAGARGAPDDAACARRFARCADRDEARRSRRRRAGCSRA